MTDQLLIQHDCGGLLTWDKSMVDTASGDALVDKTPVEARKSISMMATNSQQYNMMQSPQEHIAQVKSLEQKMDSLTFAV
ncbi:hypothetical protein TorRG33x02_276560 [Trema orientale]|uniref:Uncharacterized protein n=1 Tax=Trema orientale TaxID=63057 RepID=A0A2P5CQN7_TREOI|nr:hypothetical protein TorRG33x02_276560 [Trema orientale]